MSHSIKTSDRWSLEPQTGPSARGEPHPPAKRESELDQMQRKKGWQMMFPFYARCVCIFKGKASRWRQCDAQGNVGSCNFLWMLLWHVPPALTLLQTKYAPSWRYSLMSLASFSKETVPCYTAKKMNQERLQEHDRVQSVDWPLTSVGKLEKHPRTPHFAP